MKSIINCINEAKQSFRIKSHLKKQEYKYKPKTKDELIEAIKAELDNGNTDLNCIDTSLIDDMTSIFDGDSHSYLLYKRPEITKIDISGWNVSNVKSFKYFCFYCTKIESFGDLSNWDVSNAQNMSVMFSCCNNLKTLGDLSKWDIHNATNINEMFSYCYKLQNIGDISGWDISNLKSAREVFAHCTLLTNIGDLNKWNISMNCKTMDMFKNSGIKNTPEWYIK